MDNSSAANGTGSDFGSASLLRQSAKQQSTHAQLVQFQQQQAVQQQMQRLMASDTAGAAMALDVNPDHMNDMLTNHFARNSPDSKVISARLLFPESTSLACLPDHMSDMLTNHFARNSPNSKVLSARLHPTMVNENGSIANR